MSGLAAAATFGLYSLQPTRQETIERNMMSHIYQKYGSEQKLCQKTPNKFHNDSKCNVLLVQGGDKTKRDHFRNDMAVMAGLYEEQGCYVVSICADTHSKSQVLASLKDLTDHSTSKNKSVLYYTGHGGMSGYLAYGGFNSKGKTKGSTASTIITKQDLDARLVYADGRVDLIFDNCHAVPELGKGHRIDSSDAFNHSYFASHVDMSYFTLVLAYTWSKHGTKYSNLEQVAKDLAEKKSSLPSDVLELMNMKANAFDSITVHQDSAPVRQVCEIQHPTSLEFLK